MPNTVAAPTSHIQRVTRAAKQAGNNDEDHSSEESPSGPDTDDDSVGQNGQNGANKIPRGMKRKRPLIVSCELCKQRKVKCDRAQPSCGWCARNGQLCEYKERKKPGLRAGYGKELEQRLNRLEEIIQAQGRLIETHILQDQPHSNQGSLSYTSLSEPSACHGPSPRSVPYSQESVSAHVSTQQTDIPITGLPDTSVSQHQLPNRIGAAVPFTQAQGTNRGIYAANESSLRVPVDLYPNEGQSFSDPDLDLPPYDLLYALVDLYFEHINTWCPILHRRTTLDTFFGPSPLDEADRIVLYAIVATTLRFSSDLRLNEHSKQRYHDAAKQKVLLYGLENSSVKALQALVILALDLVGSSNGPPGWKLLALIARSLVQLGLAAETKSSLAGPIYPSIYTLRAIVLPEPGSWIEDEGRRRLFWMVYLLDRYSTIATAFDFALDDKDINLKLPCKEEYFVKNQPVETRWFRSSRECANYVNNHPENVGSFGLYVEVLGILSRIHVFLKRPVDIGALSDVEEWQSTYRKLDNELKNWEYHLPTEYAYENLTRYFNGPKQTKNSQCDLVQLHATYQTAVIRLHSSAAYPTTRSPIFTPSYGASQRCLLAVDNILSITRFVVENNLLDKLGPPFAFTLWVCARLLLVHGSTIAQTVSPDILFFVDTLARMGKHWKVAGRYSSILQRVLNEYNEYQQSSATDGERATPSTVRILADMRRCAFDLDFLISNQPRSSTIGMTAIGNGHQTPSITTAMPPRDPAPNELEYLDVFGFFNFPRVVPSRTPDMTNISMNETTSNDPMSINGLTESGQVDATPSHANEFNITNYLVPTPETDWLFRSAG